MDTLWQDLRYSFRTLSRARGFTLTAVACLALGIGINTGIFTVVNAFLFRPFPFPEPERLAFFTAVSPRGGNEEGMSAADLADVAAGTRSFEALGGSYERNVNLTGGPEPERVEAASVSHTLFPALGVRPVLGRLFRPDEDRPGAERVVLLSHALWQRNFGGRPDVVGRAVQVNGAPALVVGVMPEGFGYPNQEEVWLPLASDPGEGRGARYLFVVGRLRPGATLEGANAEMAAVARALGERFPETNGGWSFRVQPLREAWVDDELPLMMWTMMGAVSFVLLIACANVANLLLARATGRQREVAIRAALGARRGRLVRQMLTESVLVSLAGGALGALFGTWWVDWILSRIPERMDFWVRIEVDGRVLLFTTLVSVGTGVLFGILPALRASRVDLQESLKDGSRGATAGAGKGRLRGGLVVAEIALSLVLLVGAGLMVRSFLKMQDADPGFRTERLLTMQTYLAGDRYAEVATRGRTLQEALARVEALPGVESAVATSDIPALHGGSGGELLPDGIESLREPMMVTYVASTPGLYRTLGLEMTAGRDVTWAEAADTASTAVVVSEELAARLWPGQDPLGRRLRLGFDSLFRTVVGVVPSVRYDQVGEERPFGRLQVHLPYAHVPVRAASLLVRTRGDAAAATAPVQRALRGVDPSLPFFEVRVMDEVLAFAAWSGRVYGEVFTWFAAVALLLAAVGVYGVVAYSTSQRLHEIGVRMALGARAGDVQRLIVGQGAVLAGIGLAIGLLGAFGVTRVLSAVLYGVSATDPWAYALCSLLLAAVATSASYLPARRAARVDPMIALRHE
jgi:putative ABC transport system permease protein